MSKKAGVFLTGRGAKIYGRQDEFVRPRGETGLLLAVIDQAATDLVKGKLDQRATAARYFAGPVYREDLELLELPSHWLPKRISRYIRR